MPIVSSHGLFNTGTLPGDVVNNQDIMTHLSLPFMTILLSKESHKLIFDFYSIQVYCIEFLSQCYYFR